ncbi:hypothetical protein [Streptomyces ureilyticus]|nr:hypothetical protein [Streptomyces ureilyticus]
MRRAVVRQAGDDLLGARLPEVRVELADRVELPGCVQTDAFVRLASEAG